MRIAAVLSLLVVSGTGAAPLAHAAGTVRVPQDARTLEAALSRVTDAGVIELAAGTYSPSGNSFAISNARKGFTIRAAAGAQVVLDGKGTKTILRYVNSDRGKGKRVSFERLIFRNGFSSTAGFGGAATLTQADALFTGCTFENNRTDGAADGGAVRVLAGTEATFVDTAFRNNTSLLRGGALLVFGGKATLRGGALTDNRVNLPGHPLDAAGGGIFVLDGSLRVHGTTFERNLAGWVGGAIYAFGIWDGPGTDVVVTGSTFIGNQALPDACCTSAGTTAGGAIHVEDKTTLRVHQSLLRDNRADFGGGISSYRSGVEVYASVFQQNRSAANRPGAGVGGAIASVSNDAVDSTTAGGTIDRPVARLVVERSLFQGGASDASVPLVGGCIFAEGDSNRLYGENGVPAGGTVASNRSPAEIRGSVFSDCDVASSAGGPGAGGALSADLADLTLAGSMVLDSDARGAGGRGGGVAVEGESAARITGTTFANNSAEDSGGGLFAGGSTVDVTDCRFYANAILPDLPGTPQRGAGIFAIPRLNASRQRNVGGLVQGSAFFGNNGIPVWDVDPQSGPTNEMRYNDNRFDSGSGGRVYLNSLVAPGGIGAGELNFLTVFRGDGRPPTDKSDGGNTTSFAPREGAVVDVPAPGAAGAAPANSINSTLAFATAGGPASLGTFQLGRASGLIDLLPGDYPLQAGGATVAAAHLLGTCSAGPYLCLNGNRFRAEAVFKVGPTSGVARAASLTPDTGTFWFFDPANIELAVKVLDGRSLNRHFWVFYGALSNVDYTLTVTDTRTGAEKSYHNPNGAFASAGDTTAFPAAPGARRSLAGAALAASGQPEAEPAGVAAETMADLQAVLGAEVPEALRAAAGSCVAGPQNLCLNNGRFRVELTWRDQANNRGAGQAVAVTSDTGYFYFTSPANLEVFVKVLDGRPVNNFFWVFFGALTNLEYTLTVTDTMTGAVRTYTNPLGRFASRGDTQALPG